MKTLNTLSFYDDFIGIPCEASYKKDFTFFHSNGYVTLYYKGKYIDTFMLYSNSWNKIKNELKNGINTHDIKSLLNYSIDKLYNMGFSTDEIEKISSYIRIKNDTEKKHKEVNKYLLNEIKEYFIFRLVRK